MRKNARGQAVLAIALTVVGSGAFAGQLIVAPTNTDEGPQNLKLVIEGQKAVYALYEPVYVTCTVKNPMAWSIVAQVRSLRLMDRYLKLSIEDADGKVSPYYSGPIVDTIGEALRDFAPAGSKGDSIVETVGILFNDKAQGLAFPHAGHYRIFGKVYLGNYPEPIVVNADPVAIDVVKPEGVDKRFMEAVGSEEALVLLLKDGATDYCDQYPQADCYERLRTLVGRFAECSYSPAIALNLATELGRLRDSDAGMAARVISILQEFIKQWPVHPQTPTAMRLLARELYKGGRKTEAGELVEQFEKKYPGRESPRKFLEGREKRS